MRVGFGKVDITPELGLPMVGMPGSPRGEGVVWPLHGRVMLADDGAMRVAIVSLDVIALVAEDASALRGLLAEAGGLAPEQIMIACSHTHRAPLPSSAGGEGEGTVLATDPGKGSAFLAQVAGRLVAAMRQARNGLQPATLSVGRVQAPGWAFNRRPIYANGQVGTHGWTWLEGFAGMEGVPDDELWTLVARGEDGAVLGGLVGFACHPTAMGHDPVYSADYPGVLTEALEARYGDTFGFLLGAAGDTSTPDPSSRDPESGFGQAHTAAMGAALAAKAEEAIAAARPMTDATLGVATTRVEIAQRLATPELVELARWYLEERPADLDELEFTRRFYGHDHTFADGKQVGNARHAEEMLRMWAWQQSPQAQLVEELEVQALRLGDVAIVALPVELFTAIGEEIKRASPYSDTFLATLANGWHGYVPTREAFTRGGYEPRFAYPSRLVEEAGDSLRDAAAMLLRVMGDG